MSTRDDEPTHTIPMPLQRKLKEAKEWADERQGQVEAGIPDSRKWMQSDIRAVDLLEEIVEMCDDAWGFGP